MSARERYAELPNRYRRSAARHVRRTVSTNRLTQQRLDVWAEIIADGLVHDGQVDPYWLYCWELGSRVYGLRCAAGIVAGAR